MGMKISLWIPLVAGCFLLVSCGEGADDDDDTSEPRGPCDPLVLQELTCPEVSRTYDSQVMLTSDEEVAEFFAEFDRVGDSLHLSGVSITDAPGLACLKSVRGEFSLSELGACRLDLPLLETVGAFHIKDNTILETVAAPALASVDSSLAINSNESLRTADFRGLMELRASDAGGADEPWMHGPPEALEVQHNPKLAELMLGSVVSAGAELMFNDCDSLAELAMPQLTSVAGYFRVDSMGLLQTVELASLTEVSGLFRFDHNGVNTTQVDAIPPSPLLFSAPLLDRIGGDLYFDNNPSSVEVDFGALREVGGDFLLRDSITLETLDLGQLESVGGDLSVTKMFDMSQLHLDSLALVGGAFSVLQTRDLTTLSLPLLTRVGGTLALSENEGLEILSFSLLTEIDGDLSVQDNPMLPDDQVCTLYDQLVLAGGLISDAHCDE
jgi:hypothetical protein